MTQRDRRPTDQPWDDDRLTAAFVDRYDRPAPRELIPATLARVSETSRRPRWWPALDWPSASRLAAAVALVAVVSVVGVAVMPRATQPTGTPAMSVGPSSIPSAPQNTPYQSFPASPAVEGFAARVAGLTVVSVADATRLFDDPASGDTEFAVAGWYSARHENRRCPAVLADDSPLIDKCGAFKAWLSGSPDPILGSNGQPLGDRTHGPTLEPWFVSKSDVPMRLGTSEDPWTTIEPQPVILIGHVHDDRSIRCKSVDAEVCERTFVVDQYASATGILPTPPIVKAVVPTRLDGAEALRIARQRIAEFGVVLKVDLQFNADAPWFSNASSRCACPLTWFARGFRFLPDDTTDPRGPGTPVAGWLAIDDETSAISGTLDESLGNFPATIEGLPVRNLDDIVRADLPIAAPGTPVAVAGWYSQLPVRQCSTGGVDCNRDTRILAGSSRQLVRYVSGGGVMLFKPDGPVINPVILPGGASTPQSPGGVPVPVILVMHQGDPRADQKGPGDPVGARDWVLDQVAWLDGAELPAASWIPSDVHPRLSLDAVDVLSGGKMHGPWWMISVAAVQGADLPAIGGPANRAPAGIVWMLRAAGTDPAGGDAGAPGWGVILIDDAAGTVAVDWMPIDP